MKKQMIWKTGLITAMITLGICGSAYARDYPSKTYHLPTVKERPEEENKDKQEKAEEEKTEPAVTPAEEKEPEKTAAPEEPAKEEQEAIDAGGEEAVEEQKDEEAEAADDKEKDSADKAGAEDEKASVGKKEKAEEPAASRTEAPAPAAKEDLTVYVWEKDENGSLVLDKDGNPVPVLKKGQEIPKEFKRDENGELVLDENGDPIVTFTVPEKSILIDSIRDALDKDRSIDIYVNFGDQ